MESNYTHSKPLPIIAVGDIARLRKAHPCGGREWRISQTGSEIGLECLTCGRSIQLSPEEFERRCLQRTGAV